MYFSGERGYFRPQNGFHNSELDVNSLKIIFKMKETKSRTKVTLTVLQNKKNRLRKFCSLVLKMMHLHHSGSPPWNIFILPKEKDQEVQENYVNHFPKKISHVGQVRYFWPRNDKYLLDLY